MKKVTCITATLLCLNSKVASLCLNCNQFYNLVESSALNLLRYSQCVLAAVQIIVGAAAVAGRISPAWVNQTRLLVGGLLGELQQSTNFYAPKPTNPLFCKLFLFIFIQGAIWPICRPNVNDQLNKAVQLLQRQQIHATCTNLYMSLRFKWFFKLHWIRGSDLAVH